MIFRSKPPIRRTNKGAVELDLGREERDVLELLTRQLGERLNEGPDDPDLRRLYPTAYHQDPERDAEYQILARSELTDARMASLALMRESLYGQQLSDEQLQAWLTTVNQLRLVLGTRLDIGEEDDDDVDDFDDPSGERMIYHWLTFILSLILDATRI